MKYTRFEDLPVWQDAIRLAEDLFVLTEDKSFRFKGDIANQIQRAALSVSNNTAEGFERGTTQELIAFLYYARGSAGEVRSILCLIERMEAFAHLKSQIPNLKSLAESISRQLRAWADQLQNSDIKGQRHLTDRSQAIYRQDRQAQTFVERMKDQHEKRLQEIIAKRKKDGSAPA
ncbi:MAG: four helix bundle protein [Lentisphaerota bacterium]